MYIRVYLYSHYMYVARSVPRYLLYSVKYMQIMGFTLGNVA